MTIILNNVYRRKPKNPQFFLYNADKVSGAGAIARTILCGNACRSKPINPGDKVSMPTNPPGHAAPGKDGHQRKGDKLKRSGNHK